MKEVTPFEKSINILSWFFSKLRLLQQRHQGRRLFSREVTMNVVLGALVFVISFTECSHCSFSVSDEGFRLAPVDLLEGHLQPEEIRLIRGPGTRVTCISNRISEISSDGTISEDYFGRLISSYIKGTSCHRCCDAPHCTLLSPIRSKALP